MSGQLKSLLLFPEAFGILVLSKLYLVGKASLVPTMVADDDDLASSNAKLAVLAAIAGFAVSPIAVAVLQLGAAWVLRLDFFVFLVGAVAAVRLPRSRGAASGVPTPGSPAGGRPPSYGPAPPLGGSPLDSPPYEPGGARSSRRLDARAERRRLGLPLIVPEVTVALLAATVIRGAFGFMTFFLAFELRAMKAPTWWYGLILFASGVGGMAGSMVVPAMRRLMSEQWIIVVSLVACAVIGVLCGWSGSIYAQPALAVVVAAANTTSKPAFDSLAQHRVPPAALGRAFGRFETQLQLAWVVCALLAVVISLKFRSGDILIATGCGVAAVFYFSLRRSLGRHGGEQSKGRGESLVTPAAGGPL
jgi:hypothetical protein